MIYTPGPIAKAKLLDPRLLPQIFKAFKNVESFRSDGPHGAIYASSPREDFLKFLDHLKLDPELPFADLGAGFFTAFCAATKFLSVTGFEIDRQIYSEIESVRSQLGINNIRFRNEDFLAADLTGYEVVNFYQPFFDDFGPLMRQTLGRLTPGTIALSYATASEEILPAQYFRPLHSNGKPVPANNFDAHVRTGFDFPYKGIPTTPKPIKPWEKS